MKRSTVQLIILGLVIVGLVLAANRVVSNTGGTRTAAEATEMAGKCNSKTMKRLADALVEVANAFAAPPAPNTARQDAVNEIVAKAEAMKRQASRCAAA